MINLKGFFLIVVCLILLAGCEDGRPVVGPYPKTGTASWYDPSSSSPELFSKWDMTCAMRKTDYGKYYRVCNLANNKCVFVRHNDFGPSRSMYRRGRVIDLSKTAFRKISDLGHGLIKVSLSEVYNASIE